MRETEKTASTAKYSRRGDTGTLKLEGVVGIFDAAQMRILLKKALKDERARCIQIDLTGVTRLDIAAWQIMTALGRDVTASGRGFSVIEAKPHVVQAPAGHGAE